jgi:hypothetical protein
VRSRRHLLGVLAALFALWPVGLVAGAAAAPAGAAGPSVSAAAVCGPAPSGKVAVMMVVDRGAATPSARCVTVAQGATGLDALRAAGHTVRLDGGFVCGIDGLPATGCGNVAGSPYWSYWHAAPGGEWSYSRVGAGGYRLPTRCAVEGWVWSDPPSAEVAPRLAPPAVACAVSSTTTVPSSGGAPSTAPSRPTTTAVPGTVAPPAATGGDGDPSPGAPADGSAAPPSSSPPASTPSAAVGGVTTIRPPGGAVGARGAGDEVTEGDPGDAELAAANRGGGDRDAPWGAAAGVGLILLLGGAALWRARQRRGETDGAL